MDILVRLAVPNFIYRFYEKASNYVVGGSAEDIMADALCAYAGLLNKEVADQLRTIADTDKSESL